MIGANNGHLLAFDNLSGLPTWLSDGLCRLASGGSFVVRQLYTNDDEEVLFKAARPALLNGIDDVIARSDLAERALFLTLEPLAEENWRSESAFWPEFEMGAGEHPGRPAECSGMASEPWVPYTWIDCPRMADFALWSMACETELARGYFRSRLQI
jgi:hypothetical protein